MRRAHEEAAEESLNKILEAISEHILSLPEGEARKRLESIDKANAIARAAEARTHGRPSKTRAAQPYRTVSPASYRNAG